MIVKIFIEDDLLGEAEFETAPLGGEIIFIADDNGPRRYVVKSRLFTLVDSKASLSIKLKDIDKELEDSEKYLRSLAEEDFGV